MNAQKIIIFLFMAIQLHIIQGMEKRKTRFQKEQDNFTYRNEISKKKHYNFNTCFQECIQMLPYTSGIAAMGIILYLDYIKINPSDSRNSTNINFHF